MAQDNEIVILEDEKGGSTKLPPKDDLDFEQEEFISLDEVENVKTQAASTDDKEEEEEGKEKKPPIWKNKKILIIAGASFGGLLLVIVLLVIFLIGGKEETAMQVPDIAPIPEQKLEPINYKINKSRIEEMLGKANSLYEGGNKIEALKIYENVAIYNEALSYYNLGVSQMNQEKHAEALESFKKAIANQENTDVSALNAAVCSLFLGRKDLFKYYIDVARAFLTPNSSAYNYYSALVNYYAGYYIEAFHILDSIEEGFYASNAKYLKSKILSLINKDKEAIAALSQIKEYDTNFPLGLLHARAGNFDEAIFYLNKVDSFSPNVNQAALAKALVHLQMGSYQQASNVLEYVHDINTTFIHQTYPIKAKLKDDYFNIDAAQQNYDEKLFFHKNTAYAMLFYFTPFKVFDAKQAIDYITKAGIGVFVDQSEDADEYLKTSGLISKVNANLSKTIEKALNNKLREANADFARLMKEYPGHTILQFNLALSYAQLSDYANAYKHFIASYHLNPKNHLVGVYAIICAGLSGRDYRHLFAEVTENLAADETMKEGNFYETLLAYLRGNIGALNRWLDEYNGDETLQSVFSYITAMITNRDELAKRHAATLIKKLPNDILTGILDFLANNDKKDIKSYAQQIQMRFFRSNFDLATLYGGSNVVKEQFIKLLQISGLVDVWRTMILKDLEYNKKSYDILYTLAYTDLFTQRYEEAFNIFNDLIHNQKEQDFYTLFLAAVASIGANHPQNAVAYLELAKLTNPTDPGSRIALGYLYQELGNIPAALSQYKSVGNTDYKSRFFTFALVK